MPTTSITYVEGLKPRRRASWLLLVTPTGEIVPFPEIMSGITSASIYDQSHRPVALVRSSRPVSNGVWSTVTHELSLAEGVRAISGSDGFETGTFLEGLAAATRKPCSSWTEVAAALGVGVDNARAYMTAHRPKTTTKLDEQLAAEALMMASAPPIETPTVSSTERPRMRVDGAASIYEGHELPSDMTIWSVGATPALAVQAFCRARLEADVDREPTELRASRPPASTRLAASS